MPDVKITNMIKLYTLCLLSKGPKHGYELIKELEKKLNRNISTSHIYPFLRTLQRNKFIDYEMVGKREKKRYNLTPKGKSFVEMTLKSFGEIINTTIKRKVTICARCGYKLSETNHEEKHRKIVISH